jgi:hypothetical protein
MSHLFECLFFFYVDENRRVFFALQKYQETFCGQSEVTRGQVRLRSSGCQVRVAGQRPTAGSEVAPVSCGGNTKQKMATC